MSRPKRNTAQLCYNERDIALSAAHREAAKQAYAAGRLEEWGLDWNSSSSDEEDIPLRTLYTQLLAPDEAITKEELRRERARERTKAMEAARARAEAATGEESKEDRLAEARTWIKDNRNRNTERTYESGWRQFTQWAQEFENPLRLTSDQIDLERPSEAEIAAYLRFVVEVKKGTMGSVAAAIAAIADHIRYLITPSYNPCSSETVRLTQAALTPQARPSQQKAEIGWSLLVCIIEATQKQAKRANRRDALMFLLAYCTLLRTSEVARMDRADIKETTEEIDGRPVQVLRCHVNRLAKNDKKRQGHERLVAERPSTAPLCLVRLMRDFVNNDWTTGAGTSGALFQSDKGERLSADTPRGRLRHWMHIIGAKDPSAYGFHSLRAGGATDAAQAGVAARDIQMHGNWKSDAVLLYIRPQLMNRLAVGNALGAAAAAASPTPIDIDG